MQFKHKLIYFALCCAFVVIAQVLLNVLVPQVTAQGKKSEVNVFDNAYQEFLKDKEQQRLAAIELEQKLASLKWEFARIGKYKIYQPTTSAGYEYLLNTETGDCWRKVLYTDISAVAWEYMPKRLPMEWDDWVRKEAQQKREE